MVLAAWMFFQIPNLKDRDIPYWSGGLVSIENSYKVWQILFVISLVSCQIEGKKKHEWQKINLNMTAMCVCVYKS